MELKLNFDLLFCQFQFSFNQTKMDRMPPWGKEEVILPIEGLEAIKLNDFQGLDQEAAARMMNVRLLGESWLRQWPFGGNTSNRGW